jgi:hypothetical protein
MPDGCWTGAAVIGLVALALVLNWWYDRFD